jgi:hypothetical protein
MQGSITYHIKSSIITLGIPMLATNARKSICHGNIKYQMAVKDGGNILTAFLQIIQHDKLGWNSWRAEVVLSRGGLVRDKH